MTVYHLVLAGRDMLEKTAILKTIKDINSLVEFCSVEESGRKYAPTASQILSESQEHSYTAKAMANTAIPPMHCYHIKGVPGFQNGVQDLF